MVLVHCHRAPHAWVEVKPNICWQVSAEVKTTSGWPILQKLHQLFENSRLVPALKKNIEIITIPHI